MELRSDFSLSRQELADVDRDALDINLDDLAFLRITGGKVSELWGIFDQVGLQQQIGE